jgi:hypothetical protein
VRHFFPGRWVEAGTKARKKKMSKARIGSTGVVLVMAMAFALPGPALAGGATDGAFSALAGNQLSTTQLGKARGGTGLVVDNSNLSNVGNSETNTLNDTSKAGGTLNGFVGSDASGWGIANNITDGSSGIFNQAANTGNNVMINQSMSIFVNAQ